ncbi:hypothetical protein [Rhodoblastus sp.]|uniref:hypothetical protein n=1 Tax=Rhodoblastus sp. TaxID=1962975 RepID=UPI0026178F9F|nr:hypothetical protein [Rhodoblastus sp.]
MLPAKTKTTAEMAGGAVGLSDARQRSLLGLGGLRDLGPKQWPKQCREGASIFVANPRTSR